MKKPAKMLRVTMAVLLLVIAAAAGICSFSPGVVTGSNAVPEEGWVGAVVRWLQLDRPFSSPWFIGLACLLGLVVVVRMLVESEAMVKRPGLLVLHAGILLLLLGALVDCWKGEVGSMPLDLGSTSSALVSHDFKAIRLAFGIRLDEFDVKRDEVSGRLVEISSTLSIWKDGKRVREGTTTLGKPLRYGDFALHQSPLDPNTVGACVVELRYAPGRKLAYVGLAALGLGVLLHYGIYPLLKKEEV